MADGSVEIRVTGSVDPSVVASANEAKAAISGIGSATTVSASAMAAALAATGGNIKKITPDMLGLAAATTASAVATGEQTAATAVNTVATEVNTHAAINSRSVYEGLALVHEAMAGRFTRMASTSLIFGQALAGQSAVTSAVAFATSAYGLAIIGTVAAIALATAATISYESEEKKLTATAVGLGAQSGLTAEQLKKIGESADSSSQSIRETTKAAEAFASEGLRNEETVKQLSTSVEAYSQLIGVKFAEAQKALAAAMKDPIKGAKDLHEQLGILDGDQLEQIQRLTELGDKDQAVAIITQALTQRLGEARTAGVGLRGEFGSLIDVLSNVYNWIGQVTEGFGREAETLLEDLIPALHQAGQAHRDAAAAARDQAQNESELNKITGKGADLFAATPEGQGLKRYLELKGDVDAASDALKVFKATLGENAPATKRAQQALDDYTHAYKTYLPEADKKLKADQLDVKIAEARHAHNKQLVADLTEQKALLEQSGVVESEAQAKALAAGSGDVAGAKTFAPKGAKGPSIVSEWTEQLHAVEIASGEFFKDQTADELAFWQGKVELTKAGSKEWLEVQSKIYEASKSIAHQTYDEHIADLNAQLEADRNNWAKEKKDWDDKLKYIADHFTKESKEYKDAYREFLAAQRQHQEEMRQAERDGEQKQLEALKSHLQAERQIREEDARATEALIRDHSNTSILAEVSAATKLAALHHQLAQQEIADSQTAYAAEDALRRAAITRAEADYTRESKQYKDAVAAKLLADKQFYDQQRQLEAKAYAQQIQDILAVKAAYHGYIDGLVSSTTTALTGLLAGTETWQQATVSIFNTLLGTVDQILSRIISNWIVNLLVGQTAQQATNAAQAASYIGVAGAAGVASMAAAPFPIDLGAPAFGAAMAADAASFAALTGLATGTNELPRDMIVQAHEGERVVPKADNRKLIEILRVVGDVTSKAPAAANDAGGSGGGDIHMHFHSVIPPKPHEMKRFFEDHHQAVAAGVRHFVRQGGNKSANR